MSRCTVLGSHLNSLHYFIKYVRVIYCNETKLFSFILVHLALPQGQGNHNRVSQLLWDRIT